MAGNEYRIWVGGLRSSITDSEIRECFGVFGTISWVCKMRDDAYTYCDVQFDNQVDVDAVLEASVRWCDLGEDVIVKRANSIEAPTTSKSAVTPGSKTTATPSARSSSRKRVSSRAKALLDDAPLTPADRAASKRRPPRKPLPKSDRTKIPSESPIKQRRGSVRSTQASKAKDRTTSGDIRARHMLKKCADPIPTVRADVVGAWRSTKVRPQTVVNGMQNTPTMRLARTAGDDALRPQRREREKKPRTAASVTKNDPQGSRSPSSATKPKSVAALAATAVAIALAAPGKTVSDGSAAEVLSRDSLLSEKSVGAVNTMGMHLDLEDCSAVLSSDEGSTMVNTLRHLDSLSSEEPNPHVRLLMCLGDDSLDAPMVHDDAASGADGGGMPCDADCHETGAFASDESDVEGDIMGAGSDDSGSHAPEVVAINGDSPENEALKADDGGGAESRDGIGPENVEDAADQAAQEDAGETVAEVAKEMEETPKVAADVALKEMVNDVAESAVEKEKEKALREEKEKAGKASPDAAEKERPDVRSVPELSDDEDVAVLRFLAAQAREGKGGSSSSSSSSSAQDGVSDGVSETGQDEDGPFGNATRVLPRDNPTSNVSQGERAFQQCNAASLRDRKLQNWERDRILVPPPPTRKEMSRSDNERLHDRKDTCTIRPRGPFDLPSRRQLRESRSRRCGDRSPRKSSPRNSAAQRPYARENSARNAPKRAVGDARNPLFHRQRGELVVSRVDNKISPKSSRVGKTPWRPPRDASGGRTKRTEPDGGRGGGATSRGPLCGNEATPGSTPAHKRRRVDLRPRDSTAAVSRDTAAASRGKEWGSAQHMSERSNNRGALSRDTASSRDQPHRRPERRREDTEVRGYKGAHHNSSTGGGGSSGGGGCGGGALRQRDPRGDDTSNFTAKGGKGDSKVTGKGGRPEKNGGKESWELCFENIPDDMDWEELRELGREYSGSVFYAKVYQEHGKPCGTMRFTNETEARRVLEELDGRKIEGCRVPLRIFFT